LLYNEISTLPTKAQTLYAIKIVFLSPRGICIISVPLRSIGQLVLASLAAKQNSVFSLRIAHIVHSLYFLTKGIFILMAPKDLKAFLTVVYAAETASQLFRYNCYPKSVEQLSVAK